MQSLNSFNTQKKIIIDEKEYKYFDLKTLSQIYNFDLAIIPNSIKIIIENLLRNEDGEAVQEK